ncbi:peptidoglycan-binding protein [Streptomyces sp. NPDC005408]|uniref:peptidoglycan-binding protein n=1 Tax=Streptomyces sp. NPDC005408 TaxID=3155341 RepID=UPI0033A5DDA2
MTVPVFEEFEPAADCDCAGCAQQRRALAAGEHPAARGCRGALVLFTAAGVVLGGGGGAAAATAVGSAATSGASGASGAAGARSAAVGSAAVAEDPEPGTEQGGTGPLHGRPLPGSSGKPATTPPPLRPVTRAEIINRAKQWVAAKVPYSMEEYWSDGYRQDCSGFVSMAWNMAGNEWTGSLAKYATPIKREQLEPGDILLFHNPENPTRGSHVTIFGGWADYTHTYYVAYEQTKPHTRKQVTPMGYWSNAERYLPYRYKGLTGTTTVSGPVATDAYPGGTAFGPGAKNKYVTQLGEMLIARGAKSFYAAKGPGPAWGEADRLATEAFQLAQGWRGADADGLPGPATWRLLVTKQGKNIPAAGVSGPGGARGPSSPSGPGGPGAAKPKYPGTGYFRPGRSNAHVTRLGRQLVERGFGKHYTSGPGPRWSEADRRAVEAFQRAQGWRGAAADGFPGPETWRRLFA